MSSRLPIELSKLETTPETQGHMALSALGMQQTPHDN